FSNNVVPATQFSAAATPDLAPLSLHAALPISFFRRSCLVRRPIHPGDPSHSDQRAHYEIDNKMGDDRGSQRPAPLRRPPEGGAEDRKSTRLHSSHVKNSYAVCCLKKKRIRLSL